jgi:hypothetical protein
VQACVAKESPNANQASGLAPVHLPPMFVNCNNGVQIDIPIRPPWK